MVARTQQCIFDSIEFEGELFFYVYRPALSRTQTWDLCAHSSRVNIFVNFLSQFWLKVEWSGIYVQSGGVDPRDAEEAAAAQTGIAGTGITVFGQVAPPPPPATAEAYKKKDAGGPTALIQKLTNDLKMEMQANEMDEKTAQEVPANCCIPKSY